jgi:hypothetical protein
MDATCVLTSTSFVFLMIIICAQFISFYTSHMITSTLDYSIHEGLYWRCGQPPDDTFSTNTKANGVFRLTTACSSWNGKMLERDPRKLRHFFFIIILYILTFIIYFLLL